jgi:hypothetical protein
MDRPERSGGWINLFWKVFAAISLGLLLFSGGELLLGEPDSYRYQHLRQVLMAVTILALALRLLTDRRVLRWALLVVCLVALIAQFGLSWLGP